MNSDRIAYLENLRKENPNDPFPLYGLAIEYQNTSPSQSLSMLEELARNHPEYLPTYYQLASLYYQVNRFEEAHNAAEKGIAIALREGETKILNELRSLKNLIEMED